MLKVIYQPKGREEESPITGGDLVAAMQHPDARCVGGLEDAAAVLAAEVAAGDLVITMGAGDVNRVGEELLSRLKEREARGWRQ